MTGPGDPAREAGGLPGALQVSFVVGEERFAWWGVEEPAAAACAAGLPSGEAASLPCALPERAGRAVVASEVPALLVPVRTALAALARWCPGAAPVGESLRVWSRIAAAMERGEDVGDLAAVLPPAGHAALCWDGTTVWSASAPSTPSGALTRAAAMRTGRSPAWWTPCCVPTSGPGWRGWRRRSRTAAASWPTRWGRARPCRRSPCWPRTAAVPTWSSVPPPWSATGSVSRPASRPTSTSSATPDPAGRTCCRRPGRARWC